MGSCECSSTMELVPIVRVLVADSVKDFFVTRTQFYDNCEMFEAFHAYLWNQIFAVMGRIFCGRA